MFIRSLCTPCSDKTGGLDSGALFAVIKSAYEGLATTHQRALYKPSTTSDTWFNGKISTAAKTKVVHDPTTLAARVENDCLKQSAAPKERPLGHRRSVGSLAQVSAGSVEVGKECRGVREGARLGNRKNFRESNMLSSTTSDAGGVGGSSGVGSELRVHVERQKNATNCQEPRGSTDERWKDKSESRPLSSPSRSQSLKPPPPLQKSPQWRPSPSPQGLERRAGSRLAPPATRRTTRMPSIATARLRELERKLGADKGKRLHLRTCRVSSQSIPPFQHNGGEERRLSSTGCDNGIESSDCPCSETETTDDERSLKTGGWCPLFDSSSSESSSNYPTAAVGSDESHSPRWAAEKTEGKIYTFARKAKILEQREERGQQDGKTQHLQAETTNSRDCQPPSSSPTSLTQKPLTSVADASVVKQGKQANTAAREKLVEDGVISAGKTGSCGGRDVDCRENFDLGRNNDANCCCRNSSKTRRNDRRDVNSGNASDGGSCAAGNCVRRLRERVKTRDSKQPATSCRFPVSGEKAGR